MRHRVVSYHQSYNCATLFMRQIPRRLLRPVSILVLLLFISPAKSGKEQTCTEGTCDCVDKHENCLDLARQGGCIANPGWMRSHCAKSCEVCLAPSSPTTPCHDINNNCNTWASNMECWRNPSYMMSTCPASCWQCVNATELRMANIPEEEIQHRIAYSLTDFGLWQTIPTHDEDMKTRVHRFIWSMEGYARSLSIRSESRWLCNNLDANCSHLVVREGSCESRFRHMLVRCSLACRYCDHIELFHKCRHLKRASSQIFGNLESIYTNLMQKHGASNVIDPTDIDDYSEDEWVLSLEENALWENSDLEIASLLESVQTLDWEIVTRSNYSDAAWGTEPPDRSGKRALCGASCASLHPPITALRMSLAALLQVPISHLEPLEFVHYQRGERFAPHSDFRLHDRWKHAGSRVLTVFITLKTAMKGGSLGFPELDWLIVEEPKVVVWPVVQPHDMRKPLVRMKSEQLPVVQGELYGVYAFVRQYLYDESNPCT